MPNAVPSNGALSQLYDSLHKNGTQSAVVNFLTDVNETDYNTMKGKIEAWLSSDDTKASLGLLSTDTITGLRLQVIEADGKTSFDSSSSSSNLFADINVPKSDFLTTGKYKINENQNSRIYNMSAFLSQSGVAYHTKYSNSVGYNQMYIAVRQGSTAEPLGNIVVSMNVV